MQKAGLVALGFCCVLFASDVHERFLYDDTSGLLWQDTQKNATLKVDWLDAKAYCEKLSLKKEKNWRLPSYMELKDLQESVLKHRLKNIAPDLYWSSSTDSDLVENAWSVSFDPSKQDRYEDIYKKHYVRCVKEVKR